ncbi:MAG: hypothetical protein R6W95_13895 [Desulfosarcina sp.]
MLLTKFASRVTILVRDGAFKATRFIVDKVLANDRIDIRWRTQVYEFFGSRGKLDKIAIFNNQTDAQEEMALDGAFIFIGLSLNSGFLKNSDIQIDPWGFVVTGQSLMRAGNDRTLSRTATHFYWKPASPAFLPPAMSVMRAPNRWSAQPVKAARRRLKSGNF